MERGDENPTSIFVEPATSLVLEAIGNITESERFHRELGWLSIVGLKEQTKNNSSGRHEGYKESGQLKGRLSTRQEISGVAPQASLELDLDNTCMNSPEDWRRVRKRRDRDGRVSEQKRDGMGCQKRCEEEQVGV